jgi:hypothetical protein
VVGDVLAPPVVISLRSGKAELVMDGVVGMLAPLPCDRQNFTYPDLLCYNPKSAGL